MDMTTILLAAQDSRTKKSFLTFPLVIIGLLSIWTNILFLIQHSDTLFPMPSFSWPKKNPDIYFKNKPQSIREQDIVEQKEKRLEQEKPNQNSA